MRKKTLLIFMAIILLAGCKKEEDIDAVYVTKKFKEYSDKIDRVEYSIQRIDTFPQGAMVWNNTGVALVEKDQKDEMFGFSFYGKRNDVPTEYIYDRGIAFEIAKPTKNYKTENGYYGLWGVPGDK